MIALQRSPLLFLRRPPGRLIVALTHNFNGGDRPTGDKQEKDREKEKEKKMLFGIDRRVWAPAAATLLTGSGVGIIIPLLPMFARDIGITPAEFGFVVSAFGASRLLSNFPASWAAERYGRRPLMVGGPLLGGAAMMSVAFTTTFPELFLTRFFAGMGGAIFMSASECSMHVCIVFMYVCMYVCMYGMYLCMCVFVRLLV